MTSRLFEAVNWGILKTHNLSLNDRLVLRRSNSGSLNILMLQGEGRIFYNAAGLRTLIVCFLALATLAPISACAFVGGSNGGYHYKVIVSVDTPEGGVTGSAVRSVTFTDGIRLPESGPSIRSEGEAVVIDLGERGVLFALTSFDDYRKVFAAFPGPPGLTPQGIDYYESLVGQRAPLPLENYPEFVTFEDFDDPVSVVQVRPENIEDIFGEGVLIKDVVIEITDAPVTVKVEKYRPSYEDMEAFMNWFRSLEYDDPRRFLPSAFKRG